MAKVKTGSSRTSVLHVVPSAEWGGISTVVLDLAEKLNANLFSQSVLVFGPEGPLLEKLEYLGISAWALGQGRNSTATRLTGYSRRLIASKFDIIHAHMGGRIPSIIPRMLGAKVVTHVHAVDLTWLPSVRAGRSIPSDDVTHAFGRWTGRLLTASEFLQSLLLRSCPGLRERSSVLTWGVDLGKSSPPQSVMRDTVLQSLGFSEGELIMFIGRLSPEKGPQHLISAAREVLTQCPKARIIFVGDGPLRTDLERAARCFTDRIIFTGSISDVRKLLRFADILVATSETEGFGLGIAEAMAEHCPVIAFRVDAIPELVVDGRTGILVPYGDTIGLARSIIQLVKDEPLRKKMGEAGRARAERLLDLRRAIAETECIYAQAMANLPI